MFLLSVCLCVRFSQCFFCVFGFFVALKTLCLHILGLFPLYHSPNSETVGVSLVERSVWGLPWCHALLVSRNVTQVTRGGRGPAGCSPQSGKPSSRNPRRGEMGMVLPLRQRFRKQKGRRGVKGRGKSTRRIGWTEVPRKARTNTQPACKQISILKVNRQQETCPKPNYQLYTSEDDARTKAT